MTIRGVFDSDAEANAAAVRLLSAGFSTRDISLNIADNTHNPEVIIHTHSEMLAAARRALHSRNETIEAA